MKNLKYILVLFVLLLLPVTASAKEKANIYIFRGEGCGYCASAIAFFDGLDDEYKGYFNLVKYEVWSNADNSALMQKVGSVFKETPKGVPYIIIGEETFNGYSSSMDTAIKAAIKNLYESDSRYDVMDHLTDGTTVTKDTTKDTAKETSKITFDDVYKYVSTGFLVIIAGLLAVMIFQKKGNKVIVQPVLVEEPKVIKKPTTKKETKPKTTKKTTTKKVEKK